MPDDDRLVCLDSDTGLFDSAKFPERYLNLGIAEHTLMGAAAGLAKSGRMPLVNTMAAFASSRANEAVKIDIALNNLPVRIAATHSGVSAGHLGPTHHALEDLAVMRALPNMTVVVPADGPQTGTLFRQSLRVNGPVYLRLGRNATLRCLDAPPVTLGMAQVLRDGADVTLAACGPYPVVAALDAADLLEEVGISASVLNVHTVKPLDVATIAAHAQRSGVVVTVEEHWRNAGFGSAVAESLAELTPSLVLRVAMPDAFVPVAGGQRYLAERGGVTAASVAAKCTSGSGEEPR